MPGSKAGDLGLDVLGEPLVGLGHVHPDRVAADGRALDTAQDRTEGRGLAPGRVAVEGVLVLLGGAVEVLVDLDQARVVL